MVKIAVAGGSGQVGREVIDALITSGTHEVYVLSRSKSNSSMNKPRLSWITVDYHNKKELVAAFQGIHTVLSFTQPLADPENIAQKNMIDAAIVAGVRRFAPSQWGSASTESMSWWAGKDDVKNYLESINEHEKVLEYTLFQPGIFMDYLATPHKTAKYVEPLNTMIDFEKCRAITVKDYDPTVVYTTVSDLARMVAKAIDLEQPWPVTGGVCGTKLKISELLAIGERVRGRAFTIDQVDIQDLENGVLTASWKLEASHPSVAKQDVDEMLKTVLIGTLLGSVRGAWAVSDDFNQCFPEFKFTDLESFLGDVWGHTG